MRGRGCVCGEMLVFSDVILEEFSKHSSKMRLAARARRQAVQLRAVVDDKEDGQAVEIQDTLGVREPNDRWEGCTNLRTLRALLSMIDDRGFERLASAPPPPSTPPRKPSTTWLRTTPSLRSPHQMKFHSSFERCVSRVVYKKV